MIGIGRLGDKCLGGDIIQSLIILNGGIRRVGMAWWLLNTRRREGEDKERAAFSWRNTEGGEGEKFNKLKLRRRIFGSVRIDRRGARALVVPFIFPVFPPVRESAGYAKRG